MSGIDKAGMSQKVVNFIKHFNVKIYNSRDIANPVNGLEQKNYELGAYHSLFDIIMFNNNYNHRELTGLENDVIMLHEIIHWTGARKRLARKRIVLDVFPTEYDDMLEELIACYGCLYLHQYLGLDCSIAEKYLDGYKEGSLRDGLILDFSEAEEHARVATDWLINAYLVSQFRDVS